MHSRYHEIVMRIILADLVRGEFQPGEQLPRELDLVARFGYSRGVIREALRALEVRRVVSIRHGSGTVVRPLSDWDPLDHEVIRALTASPSGGTLIEAYIRYSPFFALFVGLGDIVRQSTTAAEEVWRVPVRSDTDADMSALADALAQQLTAWADETSDSLRAHVAESLACAVRSAADNEIVDSATLRMHVGFQKLVAIAVADGDVTALLTALTRLFGAPPEMR